MAFRFQKRIKLGKGLGINVSKSGITPSYRNRKGSLSTKGYSVRTGIPGLTYRKTFSKTRNVGCLVLLILPLCIMLTFFSCSGEENTTPCRDTNCANYTSQANAQADFDADPECRNDLDADNDGIACEEPGNSVKTCASTSNCGCSNKNKAPCQADPCCRWVVGEGCKCG
ncbi:DUF4236 domain-containing protein [uncultured Croceitalea sp.]|jgi:hypothetical protein|uniref:DUF4236 domain-containing protein n=1 Tax=uncultured Croceitalea sp. TaxID=1798908 RepID=UPI00374EDCF7